MTIHLSAARKATCLLYILVLFGFSIPVAGQFKLPKIDKVKKTIRDATEIAYGTALLMNATARTTEEFNKTVTVVKGNKPATNPPPGKMTKPKMKKGEFVNLKWEPIAYFDKQLFPSSIVAMATYKGQLSGEFEAISRPLGIRIISNNSNIPLNWEIECVEKKYFDKISGSILYEQAGREIYLMPEIPWNYETLTKQDATTPVNIYFRIFDDEKNKEERLMPLQLRSINDCMFQYKQVDMSFMFAAFVQEEHPEIDKILKEALDTKIIPSILGYQEKTDESVHSQVEAIWKVLHDRGFKYSSITKTAGGSNYTSSQVVRTFANAIKTSQANCVDGTVVFASILRKIGIHTAFILTTGHCFLGYFTDKEKTKISFLETTLLSNSQFIDAAKTPAELSKAYHQQFAAAREHGMSRYLKEKANNDIMIVDVDDARKYIMPIPFEK